MASEIRCPKCGFGFPMEEAVSEEYKRELKQQMLEYKKRKDEEWQQRLEALDRQEKELQAALARKEAEWTRRVEQEKEHLRQAMEADLRKSIGADFQARLKQLQETAEQQEALLREATEKELQFLQKTQELDRRERELTLQLQRQLVEEREKLVEQIRREEKEAQDIEATKFQLRVKELEKQLEDQKKLAEEMRRKAEQGSMQLQGEVQELLLEEILRDRFPEDLIEEVGKGVEGADCIQIVRDRSGRELGKIIFESKRTKSWNNAWLEKLRNDMRSRQADLAVLVSQVYPKNMDCFGERDGVWVCSFREVAALTGALRNAIIRVAETRRLEENKGEKMQMLYGYLTGVEFRQQVEAIVEGFMAMKQSIARERIQMEKLWREREKQLEKVLLSTSGMYGSIRGIAGSSVHTIPLLEGSDDEDAIM